MDLVLASGSPRRAALLESLGLRFTVVVPDVDETRHPDEEPDRYVERVARLKASVVAAPGSLVLAADTTVVHEGRVLGKPTHPTEARAMLGRLSGDVHAVYTGVAVASGLEVTSGVDRSLVRMTEMTDDEIARYVDGGEPFDKAGAYALQGVGGMFVEAVDGSPSNVIGLPLHLTARLLRAHGFDPLR
ncbi:MAG TPA: Maf family protein [Acidimicrobiia bacterium]|nr:Maf family protein [Acidimicrobiia bacterium]